MLPILKRDRKIRKKRIIDLIKKDEKPILFSIYKYNGITPHINRYVIDDKAIAYRYIAMKYGLKTETIDDLKSNYRVLKITIK